VVGGGKVDFRLEGENWLSVCFFLVDTGGHIYYGYPGFSKNDFGTGDQKYYPGVIV